MLIPNDIIPDISLPHFDTLDDRKTSFCSISNRNLYKENALKLPTLFKLSQSRTLGISQLKEAFADKQLQSSSLQPQNENISKSHKIPEQENTVIESQSNKCNFNIHKTSSDIDTSPGTSEQINVIMIYLSKLMTKQNIICEQLENIKDLTNTSLNLTQNSMEIISATIGQVTQILQAYQNQSNDFSTNVENTLNEKFYETNAIIEDLGKNIQLLNINLKTNKNNVLKLVEYENCNYSSKRSSVDKINNETEKNEIEFFKINTKIDELSKIITDLKIRIKINDETYKKTLNTKSCQCLHDSTVKLEEKNKHDSLITDLDFNSIAAEKSYDFLECNCPTKDINENIEFNKEYNAVQTNVKDKCLCSSKEHLNHSIQSFKNKNQKVKTSMTSMLEIFKEKSLEQEQPYKNNNKHCQTFVTCTLSKSLLQNTSTPPVTSDEEVKIEDIYKAVSSACGYKQPKPISEPTFRANNTQPSFGSNATTDSASDQSVCTNCLSLEKKCEGKSPMSNLQIYVDYLHEQLSIISNIENQIQSMRCETKKYE